MGGRRSYSIKEVIKSDDASRSIRASLFRSITEENPIKITRDSAKLISEHRELAKIVTYSNKLLIKISEKYKPEEISILKELQKKVRFDWAKIKSDEKLDTNRIVDIGVVDAVSRTLQKIRK